MPNGRFSSFPGLGIQTLRVGLAFLIEFQGFS